MQEQVSPQKQKEIENQERLERVADVLIRVCCKGFFYQNGSAGYMIRTSSRLGYITAPLTMN